MEAFQSYYLFMNKQNLEKENHTKTIYKHCLLWIKECMRNLFSYEMIQRKIILHYFPQIGENIKSFSDYCGVKSYCEEVIHHQNIQGIIVIFISNEQIILINKTLQDIYIIDPYSMIHMKTLRNIDFLQTTLIPIFQKNHYTIDYLQLSYPAQTKYEEDYTSTWLMYLLLKSLDQLYSIHTINLLYIPEKNNEKKKLLSNFHKEIIHSIKIDDELTDLFLEKVESNMKFIQSNEDLEFVLNINPTEKVLYHHL
jgi:hypothetical protein